MIVFSRSIIILIGASTVAVAQKSDASRVCWRPRSLAKCNGWIITEASLEMPTMSTSAKHLFVGPTDLSSQSLLGTSSSGYVTAARFAVSTTDELAIRGLIASAGTSGAYIGADARFDLARSSLSRTVGATYVTVRTGGRAGPIVTATGSALFVGLLYLRLHGDST